MNVIFKITTPDGHFYEGVVRGVGGFLGDAGNHLSWDRRREAAERQMKAAIRYASEHGKLPPYLIEPSPGMCQLLPVGWEGYSQEEIQKRAQLVTLAGATFSVLN